MTFSLIHYGEIDGAYDSETSNTVSMYSPNICFLGCNREIKIIYLIPQFSSRWHLFCPSARELWPGCAQLGGAQEGKDYCPLFSGFTPKSRGWWQFPFPWSSSQSKALSTSESRTLKAVVAPHTLRDSTPGLLVKELESSENCVTHREVIKAPVSLWKPEFTVPLHLVLEERSETWHHDPFGF